jgi:hypothetical protein
MKTRGMPYEVNSSGEILRRALLRGALLLVLVLGVFISCIEIREEP